MKVIGLDLSSSTGLCVFKNGKLDQHITIKEKLEGSYNSKEYPFNYLDQADNMAKKVIACIVVERPDYVVIEETNKAKNRYSQKQLEFIHAHVARRLRLYNEQMEAQGNSPTKIHYIDSAAWRKILNISLNTNQRSLNKEHKADREAKREEISKQIYASLEHRIRKEIEGLGKREANKIIKKWDKEINAEVSKKMRSVRSKIKKTDSKDLAVLYINKTFDLELKKSQNDEADAICVAYAFIVNGYSAAKK